MEFMWLINNTNNCKIYVRSPWNRWFNLNFALFYYHEHLSSSSLFYWFLLCTVIWRSRSYVFSLHSLKRSLMVSCQPTTGNKRVLLAQYYFSTLMLRVNFLKNNYYIMTEITTLITMPFFQKWYFPLMINKVIKLYNNNIIVM